MSVRNYFLGYLASSCCLLQKIAYLLFLRISAVFKSHAKNRRNSGSVKDMRKPFPSVKKLSEAEKKRILVRVSLSMLCVGALKGPTNSDLRNSNTKIFQCSLRACTCKSWLFTGFVDYGI